MFAKAITSADLKVRCTVDVQLHILDSSCIKKNLLESSLSSLCAAVFGSVEKKCTYQSFLKAVWMTLLNFIGHRLVAKRKTDGKDC